MKSFQMSLSPAHKKEIGGPIISKYMFGMGDPAGSDYKQISMSVKRNQNKRGYNYQSVIIFENLGFIF